jgi:hypothetical protein
MWLMCSLYRNEYRNLNWPGPPWERDWGGVKRTGRDEPIGVVMYAWKQHKESPCVAIFISN